MKTLYSTTMNTTPNSLGINKPAAATRVVVAMSGGVDSSVVAAMLAREGYDVVGITLQLYDHGEAVKKKGACCAGQDIYDARRVAERIGFPHYVLDYESRFQNSVVDDFADAYLRGETPIPCVRCNQDVKFKDLLATARDLGADALATGHYVQRKVGASGRAELHQPADLNRDQSYFLFGTTQEQLDFLRFPLGGLPKSETRALAAEFGLEVADKPDSQDICFVPQGKYVDVVARLRPHALDKGEIVHIDGRVLGTHDGIINYTIGQRRGLGIGGQTGDEHEPLYVVRLDAPARRVIVGPRSALERTSVFVKEMNWLGDTPANDSGQPVLVKLRSAAMPVPATYHPHPEGRGEVRLATPYEGIAPGQACVMYDPASGGNRMLGGGWIIGAA
jgi:tRNA-specific 2-thiouridylase